VNLGISCLAVVIGAHLVDVPRLAEKAVTTQMSKKAAVVMVASDPVAMFHGTLGLIFPYLMRLSFGWFRPKGGKSPTTDTLSVCKQWRTLTEKSSMPLLIFRGDGSDDRRNHQRDTNYLAAKLEAMAQQGYKPSYIQWRVFGIHQHRILMAMGPSPMTHSVVRLHVASKPFMGKWKADTFVGAFPSLVSMTSDGRGPFEFDCSNLDHRQLDLKIRINGSIVAACSLCDEIDTCSRCDDAKCTIEDDRVCDGCSGFYVETKAGVTTTRVHPHRTECPFVCPRHCTPCVTYRNTGDQDDFDDDDDSEEEEEDEEEYP
jgi:hypothetical protein